MARPRTLTFTISRALLATGLVAAVGACDDSADQAMDAVMADASGGWYPEIDCCVNPDPCIEDRDQDGYGPCGSDCDDYDATVHPGAVEICDGKNNDCDEWTDEGLEIDLDGDGSPGGFEGACLEPAGPLDCDDADATRAPDRLEACNGRDDDCDLMVDEAVPFGVEPTEGYAVCSGVCISILEDHRHCGGCGLGCGASEDCTEGRCCRVPGAQTSDPALCCHGDVAGDGNCDSPVPLCTLLGAACTTETESSCCEGATCGANDAGEEVCCLPDGAAHADVAGGAVGCCHGDVDGDGLCDAESPAP